MIDACHSGSAMDLPFQAHVRGGYAQWEPTFHYTRVHKGTAGGFAVQFSAAKDSQTAADTQALAGGWVGGCCRTVHAAAGRRWRRIVFHWQGARDCMLARPPLSRRCRRRRRCAHCMCPAGNASTGAATYCFIQAIERRGTRLRCAVAVAVCSCCLGLPWQVVCPQP